MTGVGVAEITGVEMTGVRSDFALNLVSVSVSENLDANAMSCLQHSNSSSRR
jgi:hypothetical protein